MPDGPSIAPETRLLATPSGALLPVHRYPAQPTAPPLRAQVLVLPALGVPARWYQPLAEALRQTGVSSHVMELRGNGDSALRASWRCDFGFREILDEDIPAALRLLRREQPRLPLLLLGHSLGGHLAAISAGRLGNVIDGLVLIACGSPWVGAFSGSTGRRLRLLIGLVPLLSNVCGFFPGRHIGFGGREARRLMRDWRRLALSNRYSAEGIDEDFDAAIARWSGPLLSIALADDALAPAPAVRAVTDKFRAARHTPVVIDAGTLGDRADHYRWARTPAAVIDPICSWLTAHDLDQAMAEAHRPGEGQACRA